MGNQVRRRLLTHLYARKQTTKTKPGQAIIEMVLVIMILLTLTFGTADIGLYMYDYVQAANCVREAARRAAVRADNAASPPFCISSNLNPQVPGGYKTLPAGSEVQVTLIKSHQWIAICYFVPGMSCSIDIRAATSMRMEGQKIRASQVVPISPF